MADETLEKVQKANAEAFKKTVSQFHESVVMSDIASANLKEGSQALKEFKGVWKDEVTTPFKNLASGFSSMIPGMGLASKLGLLVWKNTLGEGRTRRKNLKKQEEQLLQALGLNKKELEQRRQQEAQITAEQDKLKELQAAAEEFGLVSATFNAENDVLLADKRHLNQTELNLVAQQQKILDLQEKKEDRLLSNAEKEILSYEDAESEAWGQNSPALQALLGQAKATEKFVDAATTQGSLFVHDKAVADEIDSQGKATGAAAKELANEQRRKDERLIDTLEGIEQNTEDLEGIKKETDKKGKGFLAKLLGGGGLMAGASSAME